ARRARQPGRMQARAHGCQAYVRSAMTGAAGYQIFGALTTKSNRLDRAEGAPPRVIATRCSWRVSAPSSALYATRQAALREGSGEKGRGAEVGRSAQAPHGPPPLLVARPRRDSTKAAHER